MEETSFSHTSQITVHHGEEGMPEQKLLLVMIGSCLLTLVQIKFQR